MKTFEQLKQQAVAIRDAVNKNENSAERVGAHLLDTVEKMESLEITDVAEAVLEAEAAAAEAKKQADIASQSGEIAQKAKEQGDIAEQKGNEADAAAQRANEAADQVTNKVLFKIPQDLSEEEQAQVKRNIGLQNAIAGLITLPITDFSAKVNATTATKTVDNIIPSGISFLIVDIGVVEGDSSTPTSPELSAVLCPVSGGGRIVFQGTTSTKFENFKISVISGSAEKDGMGVEVSTPRSITYKVFQVRYLTEQGSGTFKGSFNSLQILQSAYPTAKPGDYAYVGNPRHLYEWDSSAWQDRGLYITDVDQALDLDSGKAIANKAVAVKLSEIEKKIEEGVGGALGGYKTVDSIDNLPLTGEGNIGYIVGTNLYIYVGEGGDTLDGKYRDVGEFKGPAGATPEIGENGNWYINGIDTGKSAKGTDGKDGQPGKDGADGVSLGEIALVQELDTGAGSENKVISQKIISKKISDVKKYMEVKADKDVGKNLFDIDSALKDHFYDTNGNISESRGYYASQLIEVDEDTDYYLSNASVGGYAKCLYLDEDLKILQTFNSELSHSPLGAKYCLLSLASPNRKAQFEKGNTATEFEQYTPTKRLDDILFKSNMGYNAYLGVMNKGDEWGKGYYKQDGGIQVDPAYQYKKYPITKGTTKILTNAQTSGAYFVMFNEDDGVIRTFSPGTSTAKLAYYEIDPNTVSLGVSNSVSNEIFIFIGSSAIDVVEELKRINDELLETEKGSLAYEAFMTDDIKWTRGTNYNDRGEIESNYAWETAKVKAGVSKIKTNINTGGTPIVFFGEEENVISIFKKSNNDTVEVEVPSGCVEIGLSNKWTEQPSPKIYGIGIERTIKEIDKDIEILQGKTEALEEQITYTAFGDSISTDEIVPEDNSHADGLAYPRTLAKLINAKLDRYTIPGSGVTSLKQNVFKSSVDASLVTCMYGINDVGKINSQTMQLGDIEEIMSASLDDLANNETFLGMYRYSLESLKNRLTNPNALICCISPVTNYIYDNPDGTRNNQDLIDMRNSIKEFVMRMGGPNAGWFYIDGTEILPWDKLYFIGTDNDPDSTHPNSMGEALMAKGIFNRLPNIQLFVSRK